LPVTRAGLLSGCFLRSPHPHVETVGVEPTTATLAKRARYRASSPWGGSRVLLPGSKPTPGVCRPRKGGLASGSLERGPRDTVTAHSLRERSLPKLDAGVLLRQEGSPVHRTLLSPLTQLPGTESNRFCPVQGWWFRSTYVPGL